MRVVLDGVLPAGVGAKDVALEVVRAVGSDGAAYRAVEFVGPVAEALPVEERFVLSNMAAEMGAKAGMFPDASASQMTIGSRGRLRPRTPTPLHR